MNVLYLSCHAVLEYDEVRLLTELGHDVLCLGDNRNPERPIIPGRDGSCSWLTVREIEAAMRHGRDHMREALIERADAIICMHRWQWLQPYRRALARKKTFLRLIGQHDAGLGAAIRRLTDVGLRVIPYWPTDLELNGLSSDQMTDLVRFYKDEQEFSGWTGERQMVLTVCNSIMRDDGRTCHAGTWRIATAGLPRLLVGRGNRLFGDFTARVPYWLLKELYRQCRVYFYVGTEPASYTLNLIEAMMTGIPVVAYPTGAARELAGFTSDKAGELHEMLAGILADRVDSAPLRRRDVALRLFGRAQAREAWSRILGPARPAASSHSLVV
jgi:hypothetical protein